MQNTPSPHVGLCTPKTPPSARGNPVLTRKQTKFGAGIRCLHSLLPNVGVRTTTQIPFLPHSRPWSFISGSGLQFLPAGSFSSLNTPSQPPLFPPFRLPTIKVRWSSTVSPRLTPSILRFVALLPSFPPTATLAYTAPSLSLCPSLLFIVSVPLLSLSFCPVLSRLQLTIRFELCVLTVSLHIPRSFSSSSLTTRCCVPTFVLNSLSRTLPFTGKIWTVLFIFPFIPSSLRLLIKSFPSFFLLTFRTGDIALQL